MAVDFQCWLSQHLRQPACAGTPLKLHLPQAILCVDVALGEEEVIFVAGIDVRYAPTVAHDLDRALQAGDAHAALGLRQEAP